ncbi:bifunctional adenosylcobinamide kinase/adenosylcobinamide-phosphate guanylyltransferase [Azospirillum thermophilum]|uniref:Bifunctional adenosylcobalamin biosynthesis protein n=1 Tax=Azospirillum thermophilum TaxID=2202148 RepID=A0A2S2CRY5_9PROT|nr:bifunctional adenosylcobinamide kinase/adenosylcobinamide-phosphate guanylyltransferase [Azospirillum thermophilum]AWK87185.1 bifunctional adenosylcobinamide kinase/adenosylcobinamide-phosphate guanylyltransferase [Azospirillum thermophilum]
MADVTLVLGGARSGKSRYAEGLVCARPGRRIYVATARVWDEEMAERVAQHRRDRACAGWETVEEPLDLTGALRRHAAADAGVLVDCLTLWLTNLMMEESGPHADVEARVAGLVAALDDLPGRIVLVSNEVGLGIVPDNALARRFRDQAGRLHQAIAARVPRVVLTVAGLPLAVKGELP